ncbi:MAG: glycosyltransferase family 39 protein [Candidatus Kaelpia aquatica]|nr:glycosyltransferase family 39 protein [Candidatus Kaelpia aquatica]
MKQNKWFVILLFVVLIYSIAAICIIASNPRFSTIDAPNHAMFCVQFYGNTIDLLHNSELSILDKIFEFKNVFSEGTVYWPKLLNLSSLPFVFIFGLSAFSIKMANILYLIIFMVFSFLLALKLGANNREALFVTLVLPLYPIIIRAMQSYGLDIPLMSIVVLFFFLLLKTDGFKKTVYSILAGSALGIGLLIKGQVVIFVLLPLSIYLFSSLSKEIRRDGNYVPLFKLLANFSLFLIFTFQVGGLWWKGKYDDLLVALRTHTASDYKHFESAPYEDLGSLSYYLFYFKYLYLSGFGLLISCFSVFSVFRYIFNRSIPNKKIALSWLFFPLLALSCLFRVHQIRYVLPLIPVIAIMTVIGLRFKKPFWTIFFRSLFLIILVFRVYLLAFSEGEKPLYDKLFAISSGDNILRDFEANNSDIADSFYENLENYLAPGQYNCLIVRSAGIKNGPVGMQFWIEIKAHSKGYRILTHDLYDQWVSAYHWWTDTHGKYIILFIEYRNREPGGDTLFDKDWIFKKREGLFLRKDDFEDHPITAELLDEFSQLLKERAKKMFDFDVAAYHCKVYEYENVSAAY